jgi:hypothetical protein
VSTLESSNPILESAVATLHELAFPRAPKAATPHARPRLASLPALRHTPVSHPTPPCVTPTPPCVTPTSPRVTPRSAQVTLHGEQLRTHLRIINTDDKPFDFSTALHTYIEVGWGV